MKSLWNELRIKFRILKVCGKIHRKFTIMTILFFFLLIFLEFLNFNSRVVNIQCVFVSGEQDHVNTF